MDLSPLACKLHLVHPSTYFDPGLCKEHSHFGLQLSGIVLWSLGSSKHTIHIDGEQLFTVYGLVWQQMSIYDKSSGINPSKTFSLALVTKQLLHAFCKKSMLITNNKGGRLVNI